MKKILMLYTSMTGHTERMAERMLEHLGGKSVHVDTKLFVTDDIDVQELLQYDAIFIGVYTWADGELPIESEDFFDELHTLDLTGKVCGVFGSADSSYEDYGTAVDIMYEELEEAGATMAPDSVIVDLEAGAEGMERCREMVDAACGLIQ